MTFRELAFQEDLKLTSALRAYDENTADGASPIKSLMDNQSPIMKIWFVIMLVNLGLFLLLIH